MSEPFIAEVRIFAGNFAPRGWAFCNGQLLPINGNEALFSLIGTIYGGDGRTTFALPDLRGRAPIHAGRGPGLSEYRIGERGGAETVTLQATEIPAHNHGFNVPAQSGDGSTDEPIGNFPAKGSNGETVYANDSNGSMGPGTTGNAGGNQPHNNIQPYLAVNYIIALVGLFPSRS